MEQEIIRYSSEKLKKQKKTGYVSIFIMAIFIAVLNVIIANSQAQYEGTSFSEAFNLRLTIASVIFLSLVMFLTTIMLLRGISAKSIILEEDKLVYCSIKSGGMLSSLAFGVAAANLINSAMKVQKKQEILYSNIKKVNYKTNKNGEVTLINIKYDRGTAPLFNFEKMDKVLEVIRSKVSSGVPIIGN